MDTVSIVQTIWTVLAFLFFIGIVFWAWSGKRKSTFDKAARMALEDDIEIHHAKSDRHAE